MKRSKVKLEDIVDIENCKRAILRASRGKRARANVRKYLDNLDESAVRLSEFIKNPNMKLRDGERMIRTEGTRGKTREICKPHFFPEHCVCWAVMQVISHDLFKGFYRYSCASILGRGTHYAKRSVEKILKDTRNTKYCAQVDVKSFFSTIDKDILTNIIGRKIKDRRVVAIVAKIVHSYGGSGLPIGFYSSAPFANLYLTEADRYIKETLHIKYMVRYMDDVVMFDGNKRKLHKATAAYARHIADTRRLQLKGNWQVYKLPYCKNKTVKGYKERRRALDFVGFKFYRYKTTIRKSIFKRLIRCFRKLGSGAYTVELARKFFSYWSYIKCTDSVNVRRRYIDGKINIKKLKEIIRYESRSIYTGSTAAR